MLGFKSMRADTLFYNGNFFTPSRKKINWLTVKEGWITALGTGAPDRHLLVQKKVNLKNKYVLPGWIDAHVHLMLLGQRKFEVDVSSCRSLAELKKRVLGRKTQEVWIEAYGLDLEKWKETNPLTAQGLDRISSRIPLLIRQKDEHALWVNTSLLKRAHLEKRYPLGYLVDKDMEIIFKLRPKLSSQKIKGALLYAQEACVREGITSVHDMAMQSLPLKNLSELMRAKKYDLRVYGALYGKEALKEFYSPKVNLFQHHLTVRAQKLFIDGALSSRGAWLSEPYCDMPESTGYCLWQKKELLERVHSAFQKHFQLIFHTLGDQASLWLLKVLASKYKPQELGQRPLGDKRIRLEHVEILNREALFLMKTLGVIASMQPWHALSDGPWLKSRLGQKRLSQVGRFKDILKEKIPLCGGSDAPIEPHNPLWGIGAAMIQKGQRLNLQEAIHMYTLGGAYAEFSENIKGSLEVGKLADFVVLPKNIFRLHPKELLEVKTQMTVIGGKIVYAQ
ncbi:MAG: amidohydrolase [Deltaproteobacteria bacterium]|nr:amidohydrolase [Deltaproteobacteria bacterium]